METKYDSYYEKEIPYTMTMEELFQRAEERDGHMSEEDILAYIRYRGIDKARFVVPCAAPKDIWDVSGLFGFGLALVHGERNTPALCKMVSAHKLEDMYNPLVEKDTLHENHWYHPYKMRITPVEYKGVIDDYYFSDFCSLINEGYISLIEPSDDAIALEPDFMKEEA